MNPLQIILLTAAVLLLVGVVITICSGPQDTSPRHLLNEIDKLKRKVDHMSAALDALKAQVAKNVAIEAAAVVAIKDLETRIEDPAALQELTNTLATSGDALAAATPTPPTP